MDCELEYCIHNKNLKCRYQNVSINGYGMCAECMMISVDKAKLEEMKDKQLSDLLERTKEW